jgi:phosphoribosyl-ATP pyrophosphohydrolase/phosphoribosyl-AMP cyclohydrolase
VEREGKMEGIDLEVVRELRTVFSKPLTVAGGIQSIEEIKELVNLEVDVQLGMALYTGKIDLSDGFIASLNWKSSLLPVITTDRNGQVLMVAYTDKEALRKTFETGKMWYYSRSRQKYWMKGESSGHFQRLIRFSTDCDRDTLLAEVDQTDMACHLDRYSCFGNKRFGLNDLYDVIVQRFSAPVPGSYTATLDDGKVREKLIEEAQEVVEAKSKDDIIWEAADLLYFLTVLLQKEGITISDVLNELNRRRVKKK